MSDLISRQAAIKAIEDLQDCYNGFSDTYDKACIIGVIEEVPPIEPRNHGRWIKGVDEYYGIEMCKCSECGYLNLECEVFNLDGFRYCPNCGARMDEVEE